MIAKAPCVKAAANQPPPSPHQKPHATATRSPVPLNTPEPEKSQGSYQIYRRSLSAVQRSSPGLFYPRTHTDEPSIWELFAYMTRPPKLTPSLMRQVILAHDDASITVPETCHVLGISKSSYYAALREGRRQALETAEAA